MTQNVQVHPNGRCEEITIRMMVWRRTSNENYTADDDGCGDIDSGTEGHMCEWRPIRMEKKKLTRRELWSRAF